MDIPFATGYKLADAYVQRISLSLRVPQPEGMTLPTALQDPNANAMYKSLLSRPCHALPMDRTTGETPDIFLCLHTGDDDSSVASPTVDSSNPYMLFSCNGRKQLTNSTMGNSQTNNCFTVYQKCINIVLKCIKMCHLIQNKT